MRVLIADYSALFRAGMRRALESDPDLEVAAEVADADALGRLVAHEVFDVVVLGAVGPGFPAGLGRAMAAGGGTGAGAGSAGADGAPRPVPALVVVVEAGEREGLGAVFEALRAGASGFVDRAVGAEELVQAVRAAAGGGHFASSQVLRALLGELVRLRAIASGLEEAAAHAAAHAGALRLVGEGGSSLTARESEVLSLVACGRSNRDIATALSISEKTVKNHVSNILRKLGAECRTQAAVWAVGRGLAGGEARKP